jgi:predicted nucleic acid-binding protein
MASSALLLDSGPLGRLAHPRRNRQIAAWFSDMLTAGATMTVPEIADYEVRRSFLLAGLTASVHRLDQLKATLTYIPLSTPIMLKAAELWAEARGRGLPTADPKELDGDVILAAQALAVGGIVVTENVGHLARFVVARDWRQITPQSS